jgi:hypothetical protein
MQLPNKIRIDNKNPIIEDFSVLDSINNSSGIYYTNSLTDHVLEWEISDFTINATDGTVDFYVNDVETKEASSTSKNIGSTSLSYLNINTDGSYDIYFKATDEAGLTDESNTYTIVYDSTDPNITKVTADSTILSSSNLNDNIGEDFVKLTIEFEDANPGTYNITYGTNVLNVSDNYSVENDGTGIISINNLEVFDTETDLRIEITDYAGNSTGTITYSLQK